MIRRARRARRWLHRKESRGFFDAYPRFYGTSETGATPSRLNRRYSVLIGDHLDAVSGRSVLDLASHDGRWTFAAVQSGAARALGVEGRSDLVANAGETARTYGIDEERLQFTAGDVFATLQDLAPGSFDTIFCFGFLYHTAHHMLLLAEIKRLQPAHLIIDTMVSLRDGPLVELRQEASGMQANAIADGWSAGDVAVVGYPTRVALDMMLDTAGFSVQYLDWRARRIRDWTDIEDYRKGLRVSLRATNQAQAVRPSG